LGRYDRNIKTLTPDENESLKTKRVCIIGCGGIGGYVIEMLARIGIGHITTVDGDIFEESNFNRQLLSDEKSLGIKKAERAKMRIKDINSEVEVTAIAEKLTIENGEGILKGHDVVVDALDSVEARFLLQNLCEKLNIPMVSGAIGGWGCRLRSWCLLCSSDDAS
jgi:molybdopterin-synthase adenylyltransferase